MDEQSPEDATESQNQQPEGEEHLNRAERRHQAAQGHTANPAMPGKRHAFAPPFQQPGPGQKRTHSHRKTG